jgi:hypothetical protein
MLFQQSVIMCRTRLPDTCYHVSSSPGGVLSNSLVAVDLFEVGWAFQKHQRCSRLQLGVCVRIIDLNPHIFGTTLEGLIVVF